METQQDNNVRMVALANLKAMCEHISGVCHRYWIEEVTEHTVKVGYSNPDEYANEDPTYAVYPCYPSTWTDDEENPRVILDMLDCEHDEDNPEAWQAFDAIIDCPPLYRNPADDTWTEAPVRKPQQSK